MPSLAYIIGIGGPLCGWAAIAWLLVRASNKAHAESSGETISAEPRARSHP
jgi:hypothetical protein